MTAQDPQKVFPPEPADDGPAAHEDLTIVEHLESMYVAEENRPGEFCFRDGKGRKLWIPETDVNRFVTDCGSEHPANYLTEHGVDWKEAFFRHF